MADTGVVLLQFGLLGFIGLYGRHLANARRLSRESLSNYQQQFWREEQERQRLQQQEEQERQRLQACAEVANWFSKNFEYIAGQVMTAELAERIKSGMSAADLVTELGRRIEQLEGVVLGYRAAEYQANVGLKTVNVKLPQEYRDRHTYIVGKSGSGKTNLLRNLIQQDLAAGNGLGVIAPEHEMLTEEILPFIPEGRVGDIIYVNPTDDQPVCFNPLHLDEGEDPDLKVDEVLTVFGRLMGESGPRMEEILRQALYALIGRPGTTLLDIERLLDRTDRGFRDEVARGCRDEAVARFWQEVYPGLPKDAHLPITNRLGRLLRPKALRTMLCNPNKSLNFKKSMDEGRVMLFNLSDGLLGEQNSQLLGQLVVSKFQLAVMARAKQPKVERRNFYLYIDEFQTFTGTAGTSYEKILSRARKYRLGLILAHQQTGQIPASLLKEIMGNVSTCICFALSREDARKFAKELLGSADGQVITLPEEEILRLQVGQAWCKMGQHSIRLSTYLASQQGSAKRAQWIMAESRRNYGAAAPEWERPPASNAGGSGTGKDRPSASQAPPPPHDPLDDLDPDNVFGGAS